MSTSCTMLVRWTMHWQIVFYKDIYDERKYYNDKLEDAGVKIKPMLRTSSFLNSYITVRLKKLLGLKNNVNIIFHSNNFSS